MKSVVFRYEPGIYRQLGEEKYARLVKPQLTPADFGRFCAIDIETGEFEIADDELAAAERLQARCPDAQPWLVCVGYDYLHHVGGAARDSFDDRIRLRTAC